MKKNLLLLIVSVSLMCGFLSGCRTFSPPETEENSQPWAQPEEWQKTQGIPGFSGRQEDY